MVTMGGVVVAISSRTNDPAKIYKCRHHWRQIVSFPKEKIRNRPTHPKSHRNEQNRRQFSRIHQHSSGPVNNIGGHDSKQTVYGTGIDGRISWLRCGVCSYPASLGTVPDCPHCRYGTRFIERIRINVTLVGKHQGIMSVSYRPTGASG